MTSIKNSGVILLNSGETTTLVVVKILKIQDSNDLREANGYILFHRTLTIFGIFPMVLATKPNN